MKLNCLHRQRSQNKGASGQCKSALLGGNLLLIKGGLGFFGFVLFFFLFFQILKLKCTLIQKKGKMGDKMDSENAKRTLQPGLK